MQPASLDRRQWLRLAAITAAAAAVFLGLRLIPVGSDLNHVDFRVAGPNVIEMCDPSSPAFIPVIDVRSPVTVRLRTEGPPAAGREVRAVLALSTASGKPIGPRDLLVNHTEKLHLLVVDPSLSDYQHLHPRPGRTEGEWEFAFTPQAGGLYRIFADFVPAATGRGLYAHVDLEVAGAPAAPLTAGSVADVGPLRFSIATVPAVLQAGRAGEVDVTVSRTDGVPVRLEPVMGAYAHVVAFDPGRRGFAHLHPLAADPLAPLAGEEPRLDFQVTMPAPGRYWLWAQVRHEGRDVFAPFAIDLAP